MKTEFSPSLQVKLKQIKRTDLKLFEKIQKKLNLFQFNQSHPSLRNHKLSGHLRNTRSISINMSIRVLYNLTQTGSAYFFSIGTHDEIYRK